DTQITIPTTKPQKSAHARPATTSARGQARHQRNAAPARAAASRRTSVNVSVEPTANVIARAPNTTTSDHGGVADALLTPMARASNQPGARTTAVAKASRR